MTPDRLLIVSNRLSVHLERRGKSYEYHPSVGGLATGLSALLNQRETLWLGWPGIYSNDSQERSTVEAELQEQFASVPVFLSRRQFELYYGGFSNGAIWPLFHYFPQYIPATF